MKDNSFHVDMSGRIYNNKTIGIALVGTETKENYGCAVKGNLLKLIRSRLFGENKFDDPAKLYAICIFLLVSRVKGKINSLIICNDEDFTKVKKFLTKLLESFNYEIMSIGDFRKQLGRNVGSFADNYARIYRKRALKPKRLKGRKINVILVNYQIIKQQWERLK